MNGSLKSMTELEKQLSETIQIQAEQIKHLTEQVKFLTKKLFGSSSEKTKYGEGQLSLFEEESPFLMNQRKLMTKPRKK
jgi:transposase